MLVKRQVELLQTNLLVLINNNKELILALLLGGFLLSFFSLYLHHEK